MLWVSRLLSRVVELLVAVPAGAVRTLVGSVAFNPRLGWVRYVVLAGIGYVAFAAMLVYVVAPLRGMIGAQFLGPKLRYDAERWLATAIYDPKGAFIGTFDPRLDSKQDFNYTDRRIDIGEYTANPDHKSIPVREVPEDYWRCLVMHEDQYIGGALNPYGIDLLGVLKIPYSSLRRSLALRRPVLGVGGSTLPMQFVRVIYNTPPSAGEGSLTKLSRKLREWWLAPVIFHELTRGGDYTPLKQWAANHIWLAQRTGGSPLHGVEVTSRIVFGKEAADLTTAEQFVLASAVNKPIILLEGSDQLNAVRMDRWRYITEVRARVCAERLISDPEQQRKVLFELVDLASGPPDPKVKPRLQQALDQHAPAQSRRAQANPVLRANVLLSSSRFGLREEIKQTFGFNWRTYARGVTTTFDAVENLAFRERVRSKLVEINKAQAARIYPGFTLDPDGQRDGVRIPSIVIAAANVRGEIVRYYEADEQSPYFGVASARDPSTGFYRRDHETRQIASTGKMVAAIALANEGRDDPATLYVDPQAPEKGLETCEKGSGRYGRKAIVAFACSLNAPLLGRVAQVGQGPVQHIIDSFGYRMPIANAAGEGTPPSTAAVLGQVQGSPRRVHHMAAVVLASLLNRWQPVPAPTLIHSYDYTSDDSETVAKSHAEPAIDPKQVISRNATGFLRAVLSGPLCHQAGGQPAGTLKSLQNWCAERRGDLRLHFAKTGTSTTLDANATVDTWAAGGIQFANGAAYSYVVMVGTGSTSEPWANSVHGAQAAAPLLQTLLEDLAAHARSHPEPALLPAKPAAPSADASRVGVKAAAEARLQSNIRERARVFERN